MLCTPLVRRVRRRIPRGGDRGPPLGRPGAGGPSELLSIQCEVPRIGALIFTFRGITRTSGGADCRRDFLRSSSHDGTRSLMSITTRPLVLVHAKMVVPRNSSGSTSRIEADHVPASPHVFHAGHRAIVEQQHGGLPSAEHPPSGAPAGSTRFCRAVG